MICPKCESENIEEDLQDFVHTVYGYSQEVSYQCQDCDHEWKEFRDFD